jgi:hypothetical protein
MAQLDGGPADSDKFFSGVWTTSYSVIWSCPATIQNVFFP